MKGRNTTVIQVRARDEVADTYKALAKVRGCTVSDIVRPLLLDYRQKLYQEGTTDDNGKVLVKETRHKAIKSPSSITSRGSRTTDVISKVGRNDPCPCGSGKKYKKCHGS